MNTNDNMSFNNLLTIHENEIPIYDITFHNEYRNLYNVLHTLKTKEKKLCIVCDSNTNKHYLHEVLEYVRDYAVSVCSFTFPAGESSKTLDTVRKLYEQLILSKFDRGDLLIALGGGVVGDLTGFVAATYLRGISFIQLPTSLLAMVDSSIGGKTGVDFDAYKNMVGAFHQPKAVYINTACLKTLPKREFYSGFAEVIKYGFIGDPTFYEWLKKHRLELLDYDSNALQMMIYRCCQNKKRIVEADPKEQGERALLNLGHTIGHAVEKLKNFTLLHGECVAIGIVAAAYISYKKGTISLENLDEIKTILAEFHLPITVSGLIPEEVLQATKNDKKMLGNTIKFILFSSLTASYIDTTVTEEEMLSAIDYILEETNR